MSKIAKVQEQSLELEELKETNTTLYQRNQELEETAEQFKQIAKKQEDGQ